MKRLVFSLLLLGFFVPAIAAQTTIFIVRHAEKAAGQDKDPELTAAGRSRAESLAKILKDANVTAIYTTEFKRTQETATPLAKALGLTVTVSPATETAALAAKLRDLRGNALVVGHGNTIPDLIKALGIAEPIHVDDTDYDNLFVVLLETQPRLIRLHYR